MRKGFVYILKCANGNFYSGSTIDLDRRLCQHQAEEGTDDDTIRLDAENVEVATFTSTGTEWHVLAGR